MHQSSIRGYGVMAQVLLRAVSLALIILVGILLKGSGMVADNSGETVKKILINITLPCAIITNFSAIEKLGAAMVLLVGLGVLLNAIMIGVGVLVSRGQDRAEQALDIMCMPGYNIGAFCLPFVQNFLPAVGSVAACMLDVGNSIMCTGITYAFAAEYVSDERHGFDFAAFARRLLRSAPFVTYVGMFLLSLTGLRLPGFVMALIDPPAKANTFMAMLMLGLLFHLELRPEYIRKVAKVLFLRNAFAAVFAIVIYLAFPFELVIRQALVLLCFAPVSAVAPAYTGMCGGDEGMASCVNSLSILCSLVVITALIAFL